MTLGYVNVDGQTVIRATLIVPASGPWFADIDFELDPEVSGAVTLRVGELSLSGTVDPDHNGTFGLQRRSRIVAGANGWGTLLAPRAYHSDSGITAREIAQDAAREAGETIGSTFDPEATQLGIAYVRQSGTASRALEEAIGAADWWVDYDGLTQVGQRPTGEPRADTYQVLDFEPAESLVTLAVDDLSQISAGSIISEGLDEPQTIRELRIEISSSDVRVFAYTGELSGRGSRLAETLQRIIAKAMDARLFGKYQYRVFQMSGDRVELQVVEQIDGLPDIIPVSMWPGTAGTHSELTPGANVLVEFINGRRTKPIITAFAGKDGTGHTPQETVYSAAVTLKLGSDGASEGATLGTSHKAWADGHTHSAGGLQDSTPAPVTGVTGAPVSSSPSVSTKVFVE